MAHQDSRKKKTAKSIKKAFGIKGKSAFEMLKEKILTQLESLKTESLSDTVTKSVRRAKQKKKK